MRKNNQKNIDSLVSKILSETLEERADNLVSRLKHNEVNELGGMDDGHPKFGSKNFSEMSSDEIADLLKNYNDDDSDDDSDFDEEINELGGMDDGHPRFGRKNFSKMSADDIEDLLKHYGNDDSDFEDGVDEYSDDDSDFEYEDDDFENELDESGSGLCECGSGLYENECNECGGSYGMMDEEEGFDSEENVGGCKAVKDTIESKGGEADELDLDLIKRYNCKSLNESLKGGQKKLDKNKNNKIDAEDFKLLRGKKTETKESKPDFLDLNKNGDKKEPMKKAAKEAKNKGGKKESLKLSESELIDLIESIVKEDLKTTGGKPRGLSEYEKAHKGSGKENDDYIKSVTKKMKEYLKDGSKGEYTENPDHFPKNNGQLSKMTKKGYTMSKDGDEFIDDFLRPGMENLDYDEIQPNEDWMEGNIEGSSKTGNNPKWANAEETDLGKKLNKKRKDNKFAKLRNKSYNKATQPITDRPDNESGNGLNIKLESTEKTTKVLNEEFTKIQHLMGYSRKTQ